MLTGSFLKVSMSYDSNSGAHELEEYQESIFKNNIVACSVNALLF